MFNTENKGGILVEVAPLTAIVVPTLGRTVSWLEGPPGGPPKALPEDPAEGTAGVKKHATWLRLTLFLVTKGKV